MDLGNYTWRTGLLRHRGSIVANGSGVYLTDEVTEEGDGLFLRVRLGLGVEMYDENRSPDKE